MPLRILIVDDDIENRHELISDLPTMLRKEGYDVGTTAHISKAYDMVWEYRPHLIVLDRVFPRQGLDGIEVVKAIRLQEEQEGHGRILILLISQLKFTADDMVEGLEAGADYYAGHKDNREILAIIRRLLPPEVFMPDDYLAVNRASRTVMVKRDDQWQIVPLAGLMFDLLEILIDNVGRAIKTIALKTLLRPGDDDFMSDYHLQRLVSLLRAKLEPYPGHPGYIETVKLYGYRFNDRLKRSERSISPFD